MAVSGAITVDTRELTALARELSRIAPVARRAAQAELRELGELVAEKARSNAPSENVKATIKTRVRGLNAIISAGGNEPHPGEAAALENRGQFGTFRHPVFGDRDVWVDQEAKPYLGPALNAVRPVVAPRLADVLNKALDEALNT